MTHRTFAIALMNRSWRRFGHLKAVCILLILVGVFEADVRAQNSDAPELGMSKLKTELLELGEALTKVSVDFQNERSEIESKDLETKEKESLLKELRSKRIEYFINGLGKTQHARFEQLFNDWLPNVAPPEVLASPLPAESTLVEETLRRQSSTLQQLEKLTRAISVEKNAEQKTILIKRLLEVNRSHFELDSERRLQGIPADQASKIKSMNRSCQSFRDIVHVESFIDLIHAWQLLGKGNLQRNEVAKLAQELLSDFYSEDRKQDSAESIDAFSKFVLKRNVRTCSDLSRNHATIGNECQRYHGKGNAYIKRLSLLEFFRSSLGEKAMQGTQDASSSKIFFLAYRQFSQMHLDGLAGPVDLVAEDLSMQRRAAVQMLSEIAALLKERRELKTDLDLDRSKKDAVIARLGSAIAGLELTSEGNSELCKKVTREIKTLIGTIKQSK